MNESFFTVNNYYYRNCNIVCVCTERQVQLYIWPPYNVIFFYSTHRAVVRQLLYTHTHVTLTQPAATGLNKILIFSAVLFTQRTHDTHAHFYKFKCLDADISCRCSSSHIKNKIQKTYENIFDGELAPTTRRSASSSCISRVNKFNCVSWATTLFFIGLRKRS